MPMMAITTSNSTSVKPVLFIETLINNSKRPRTRRVTPENQPLATYSQHHRSIKLRVCKLGKCLAPVFQRNRSTLSPMGQPRPTIRAITRTLDAHCC